MKLDLNANELVLKAGDSLYLSNSEKVSGKLILTNQRIFFTTKENVKTNYFLEILPVHIKELMFFNTKRIIRNGLNVITKDGSEHKFTIKKRDEWCSMINKMY